MRISSGIYTVIVDFKTSTAASGAIAEGSKAPCYYILNAVIFLMTRVRIKGRPIYFYTL